MERPWLEVAETILPPGRFLLAASDRGLCRVVFPNETQASFEAWLNEHYPTYQLRNDQKKRLGPVIEQLQAYFAGHLKEFDLALDLQVTVFQRQVLMRVDQIPFGQTTSYGRISKKIGQPHAAQAVGAANGANPIPVIVPCHRVLGADGHLTGFGGGLPLKCELLRLEGHHIENNRLQFGDQNQLSLF